ncbi:hypothetical protein U879_18765 [Defluviimonas sp. 20V17]|nr:hypothetical protein U879_18765 [Defluviimonas sp. 20V17]
MQGLLRSLPLQYKLRAPADIFLKLIFTFVESVLMYYYPAGYVFHMAK